MAWCKQCELKVPDEEKENHAQEVHAEFCDQKLEEYIQASVDDAVEELFDQDE